MGMLFCFISEQAIIGLTALALFFAQNTVPPLNSDFVINYN